MAREKITFDGWELTLGQGVRDWESRDGMDEVASFVGDNHVIGNRGAEVWRPKKLGAGRFEVALWLGGASVAQAQAVYRDLQRAVARPHALVRVQRTLADGSVIYCDAELVGGMRPTHLGQLGYRAGLTFSVPSGVWSGYELVTVATAANATLPKTLALPGLAASTAPMQALKFSISGPITNARLTDATPGGVADAFSYMGPVGAGQTLVVNAADWSVSGIGFAPNLGLVWTTGDRLMTVAAPRPGGAPAVTMTGTAGGTGTKLEVEGRATFLC